MDRIKHVAKIEAGQIEAESIKAMKKQIQSYSHIPEKAYCVICQSWVSSQEIVAHVALHEAG